LIHFYKRDFLQLRLVESFEGGGEALKPRGVASPKAKTCRKPKIGRARCSAGTS